jgi:DNA-binding transcriptional MerR regulator
MPDDQRYSLTELADLAGVTSRTVRYYLSQGLLPAVGQSGPGAKYDDTHLARLRLIRRLQAEHLPLAEIRRRTSALGEREIRDLVGDGSPPAPSDSALDYLRSVLGDRSPTSAGPAVLARAIADPRQRPSAARSSAGPPAALPPSAASPSIGSHAGDRSQWDRIALTPDVELHIRRPLDRAHIKLVDRLVAIARELLEEERR